MKWKRLVLPALIGWFAAIAFWIETGPVEDEAATADVAIVLGAATDGDAPSPVFAARIDHAIDLFQAGRVDALLFTGGKGAGDALSEAAVARDYAIARGVVRDVIILETQSRTTYQNLSFAKPLMDEAGAETAIIVSDPLHLRRALEMADSLGFEAQASAAPETRYRSWRTKGPFLMREIYFMHHFWLFGE